MHQWNVGARYELTRDLLFEARYVGTKGDRLLQAVSFAQGFDLNDPSTPDLIFERFNQAYVAAGSPNGTLNSGATARERGTGRAFGFANSALGGMLDYNLGNASGAVISFGRARPSSASTCRRPSLPDEEEILKARRQSAVSFLLLFVVGRGRPSA